MYSYCFIGNCNYCVGNDENHMVGMANYTCAVYFTFFFLQRADRC